MTFIKTCALPPISKHSWKPTIGTDAAVSFAYRKYNQSASPGALLLEVGGHGNSLEEARYTGELAENQLQRLC